jgi:hypothetical protein
VAGRVADPTRETWRPIPSLPGVLASSHGRLMVAPYQAPTARGGVRLYGGTPTFGQWDGTRFVYALRRKTYRVAPLVCEAFHGLKPFPRAVAMHGDENARNNRPSNLAWGTQKENLNAPGFIAYCKGRTGANSPSAKARAARKALSQGVQQ